MPFQKKSILKVLVSQNYQNDVNGMSLPEVFAFKSTVYIKKIQVEKFLFIFSRKRRQVKQKIY